MKTYEAILNLHERKHVKICIKYDKAKEIRLNKINILLKILLPEFICNETHIRQIFKFFHKEIYSVILTFIIFVTTYNHTIIRIVADYIAFETMQL